MKKDPPVPRTLNTASTIKRCLAGSSGFKDEIRTRCACEADLARIALIQARAPEAAQWDVREYLSYHCTVALCESQLTGFMVARAVADGESEILNIATDPDFRRRGIARRLVREFIESGPRVIFLELRQSNWPARNLYRELGFQEIGIRKQYYDEPVESAIVMKFHSC